MAGIPQESLCFGHLVLKSSVVTEQLSNHDVLTGTNCFSQISEADNCPRENKNNSTLKFLCWILLQKGFEITGILFGRVGHTHGSLGSLAAMNDMCLLFAVTFTGTTELNQSAH